MDLYHLFGHVLGVIGSACICLAFWLVTTNRRTATDNVYLWINMSGALLLTFSLLINFNLGSFIIEMFWVGISGHALYKNYTGRNKG